MELLDQEETEELQEVIFTTAMYWRIAWGALRVYLGFQLLRFVGAPALDVYQHVMRREMSEDPQDGILQFFAHLLTRHDFSITYFLAFHFLFWGIIDIVLSYAMIRHKLWSFLISIYLILAFMAYEVFRFFHTHSLLLFAFICLDLFFVLIIRREYRKLRAKKQKFSPNSPDFAKAST